MIEGAIAGLSASPLVCAPSGAANDVFHMQMHQAGAAQPLRLGGVSLLPAILYQALASPPPLASTFDRSV